MHSLTGSAARDAEVDGAYSCATFSPTVTDVVVLDDFATRGATLCNIAKAIHAVKAGVRVHGLVLGKNEREVFAAEHNVKVNNAHMPPDWDAAWMRGVNFKKQQQ